MKAAGFNSRRNLPAGLCLTWLLVMAAITPMIGSAAQTKPDPKKAPDSPAVVGRKLFVNNCAACHGTNAQGDEGPSLHGLTLSDAFITSTINDGIKGEMPAFKTKLKDKDIKALIAYIRTLKK